MPKRIVFCIAFFLIISCLCNTILFSHAQNGVAEEAMSRTLDDQLYVYEIAENGDAVICEYIGEEKHCKIPEYLNGHKVVGIGEKAFYSKRFMRTVSMPNTIEWIGEEAFSCCDLLQSIDLGSALCSVGSGAFADCWSLRSIQLPDSLTEIPAAMFTGCWLLREIVCSDKLTEIGRDAFWGCRNLQSFDFPKTLITIGTGAFRECESLREIKLPKKITKIQYHTFMQCTHLKTIELPDQLQEIDDSAFVQCWNLRKVRIPDSVTRIGTMAFNGCSSRLVIIGKSGSTAWQYCMENAEDTIIGDNFSFQDADTGEITPMKYPVLHDLFYGTSFWGGKVIVIPMYLYANLVQLFIR